MSNEIDLRHSPKNSLYNIWRSMKQRCQNPRCKDYKNYGARGISVCSKWDVFEGFAKDMGPRPDGLTLDRIDNNGPYSKSNCQWASIFEQRANRRKPKIYSNNSTGLVGVGFYQRKGYWYARYHKEGKTHSLYFGPSKEKAIAARLAYERGIS
jgi:hypothetical protein